MRFNAPFPRRFSHGLILGVGVVLLLTVGLAVASADSGDEDGAETITTTLQPGDNFVGWVAEPLPLQHLFAALPRVEYVYRWESNSQQWLMAAPALPQRFWTLRELMPGTGSVVRVGGDEPIQWNRSIAPATGLVELRTGENWISWAGRDAQPVAKVMRGIGRALVSLRSGEIHYDPAHPQSNDGLAMIQRGDALKVTVSRDVNWLQPTGIEPPIEYPGGASLKLQERVRHDLGEMLDFFESIFGVHADATQLTIVIPRDRASLQSLGIDSTPWDHIRGWYNRSTLTLVVKQSVWESAGTGRYVLTHEYFHALQHQLGNEYRSAPAWAIEGMATWAASEHQSYDQEPASVRTKDRGEIEVPAHAPPLNLVEQGFYQWEYTLGRLATDLLIDRGATLDSPLEFFRRMTSSQIGPRSRWRAFPLWQEAFRETFGLTTDEFYVEFRDWRQNSPASVDTASGTSAGALRGKVLYPDGTPMAGAIVFAEGSSYASDSHGLILAKALTDPSGSFTLPQQPEEYRLLVYPSGASCVLFYRDGGVTDTYEEAALLSSGMGITDIRIVVPEWACQTSIEGRLLGPAGDALAGIEIVAWREVVWTSGRNYVRSLSASDGSFMLTVPGPGAYRIAAVLRPARGGTGCQVHYRDGHAAPGRYEATLLQVETESVRDLAFQIDEQYCTAGSVKGALVNHLGAGLSGVGVRLSNDGSIVSFSTGKQGEFELSPPEEGSWMLSISLDGCTLYQQGRSFTADRSEASWIDVGEEDVTVRALSIPSGACQTPFSGRSVDAGGRGLGGLQMFIGNTWLATGTDGSFDVKLALPGEHDVSVWMGDRCWVFRTAEGWSADSAERVPIIVPDSGLSGIEFRLPEDPASLCG